MKYKKVIIPLLIIVGTAILIYKYQDSIKNKLLSDIYFKNQPTLNVLPPHLNPQSNSITQVTNHGNNREGMQDLLESWDNLTVYENKDFGISFKYPSHLYTRDFTKEPEFKLGRGKEKVFLIFSTPDFTYEEQQEKNLDMQYYMNNTLLFYLKINRNEKNQSLYDYIKEMFGPENQVHFEEFVKPSNISKPGSYLYKGGGVISHGQISALFFEHKNNFYHVELLGKHGGLGSQNSQTIFFKILDTIQFN